MRLSAMLLALILPALAALAAVAVLERVAQYGWTPDRLAAATAAAILCGHGVVHGGAVLLRGGWMHRIRRGNVLMGAVVLLAAAGWLAPVWSPQAVSARSIEARIAADPESVVDHDLWLLARRYGVAGQEALSRIGQATPELAERVARAREDAAGSAAPRTRELVLDELRGMLAVLPEGEVLPDELLQSASDHDLENFLQGCRRDTPGGAPGCVAVVADFLPLEPGKEGLLVYMSSRTWAQTRVLTREETGFRVLGQAGESLPQDGSVIDRLLAGEGQTEPLPANAVKLGDSLIFLMP